MAMKTNLVKLQSSLERFFGNEKGATVIEYTLIVSLIFLVITASIRAYSDSVSEMYSHIESGMDKN